MFGNGLNFGGIASAPVAESNFKAVIYTGNGSTQSISTVGFQPGLTWVKTRDLSSGHVLRSIGMNSTSTLSSNSTAALNTSQPTGGRLQLDSDGFTVRDISNNGYGVNGSNNTQVAWNWKAGGAAVSNTDGSITSQVSANPNGAFSIVKYTGNGNTSQQSYGHGLNSAPELVINKNMDTATQGTNSWVVGGTLLGNGGYMFLNKINAKNTASSYNGNQVPSSSVVYISGTSDLVHNQSGINFISYCFASVSGVSQIGTYAANQSTNGPIVYTTDDRTSSGANPFQPSFVLIKNTAQNQEWVILDSARPYGNSLQPNSSNAEGTGNFVQFNSNGFQIKASGGGVNWGTGNAYLYMAFK